MSSKWIVQKNKSPTISESKWIALSKKHPDILKSIDVLRLLDN